MTIAVAVRTLSAVVFATDCKLTVKGIDSVRTEGASRWVEQTYDSATKVVHDRTRQLMTLAAGISKRRSDLVQFQREAAERRRLLGLGKIVVDTTRPDTRAFTRQVQIAVNERKKVEPSKG